MKAVFAWAFVLLLALLFVSNVAHVRAEDEAEEAPKEEADPTQADEDIETEDDLRAASDIVTTVYFPDHTDKKFPIGGDVTVLIGVQNKGNSDFNMSYVGASLHNPFDLAYYVQNFTWHGLEGNVEAGTEQTFLYTFRPDSRLEPLGFWLTAFVGYNNSETGVPYRTYFHNSTVDLVERPADATSRQLFTLILAVAVAGIVGFFALNFGSKSSSASQERGTRDEKRSGGGAASWVPEKVYKQAAKATRKN